MKLIVYNKDDLLDFSKDDEEDLTVKVLKLTQATFNEIAI